MVIESAAESSNFEECKLINKDNHYFFSYCQLIIIDIVYIQISKSKRFK